MRLVTAVAAGVFGLDQVSKYLVVHMMGLAQLGAIDVVPPYLTFRMAWNRGVNFGLLSNEGDIGRWLLIAMAVAISGWVWLWVRREAHPALVQVSAGLLIGGALGNVIDRMVYGAVADFLNMSCCGFDNPYAFNVADVAIFAGAIGLVLFSGRPKAGSAGSGMAKPSLVKPSLAKAGLTKLGLTKPGLTKSGLTKAGLAKSRSAKNGAGNGGRANKP